jgi:hypothetical protein
MARHTANDTLAPMLLRFLPNNGEASIAAVLRRTFGKLAPGRSLQQPIDGDEYTDRIHHFGALPGDGMTLEHRLSIGGSITIAVDEGLDHGRGSPLDFYLAAPAEQLEAAADALVEAARSQGLARV